MNQQELVAYGLAIWIALSLSASALSDQFAITTAFSLGPEWLKTEIATLGLTYGIAGWSAYALLHGYEFRPVFVRPADDKINWSRVYMSLSLCEQFRHPEDSWVVWVESDIWVTNYDATLERLVEVATNASITGPHVILNIDGPMGLNSGFALVRCSQEGKHLLEKLVKMKDTHKHHPLVEASDHQGALHLINEDPEFSSLFTFIPQKLCNAYPFECEQGGISCDGARWSPGDFVVHFAGPHKDLMRIFLDMFPPESWIGYTGFYPKKAARHWHTAASSTNESHEP